LSEPLAPDERRWLYLWAAVLIVLTLIPVAVAAAVTPAGHIFSGWVLEARDEVSYIGKATQGLQGHWLYHDPYTSEAQPPSLIYLPYILLGQLDRPFGIPLSIVLHIARVCLTVALLWAVYGISAEVFTAVRGRRLAFALVMLGGGLGLFGSVDVAGYHLVSLDRKVSGTAGLETVSVGPHIVLACLSLAWLALIWIRHSQAPRRRDLMATLVWTAALSCAYPQQAAMWAALAVLMWVVWPRRGPALLALAAGVGALPYVVYGQYLKGTNPIFAAWPPQSDIDVGDPLAYLLWGHLVMLPFVVIAVVPLVGRLREREVSGGEATLRLMAGWVVVSAVLMYLPGLPHILQRVYYGSFIPFGILAVAGLMRVAEGATRRRQRRLRLAVLAMMVVALATVVESISIPVQHLDDQALDFPRDEATVLDKLRADAPGGGRLVMSSFRSGLYVPALSGQDAYVGFPFETLDLEAKQREAERFYTRPGAAAEAERLNINYVLWGRFERDFGGPDPGLTNPGWQLAYSSGEARLYRTNAP
jgi:hypothetical protein